MWAWIPPDSSTDRRYHVGWGSNGAENETEGFTEPVFENSRFEWRLYS